MKNLDDTRVRSHRPLGTKAAKRKRSRGQILILFVMAIFVFVGMVALVIDVSWYWVNSLRVQRAADAAALAGVVQLPTNPTAANGAFALAVAEAKKNGYDPLVAGSGITITTTQDPPVSGRRLIVKIDAPVPTFFMRIFGINSINASRTSRAEFVLPVPMGSPDNWYGVFGKTRGLTSTSTAPAYYTRDIAGNSGFKVPTQSFAPIPVTPAWTVTGGTLVTAVNVQDTTYAQTPTDQNNQLWGNFNLLSGLAANENATLVTGLQVRLTDVHVSAACANTTIRVALSYDAGVHWTSNVAGPLPAGNITPALGTSVTAGDYTFGNAANLTAWPTSAPVHTWIGNDLGNSNFRIRLTANKGCGTAGLNIRVDMIEVQANFLYDRLNPPVTSTVTLPDVDLRGPGAPCTTGKPNCFESTGQLLQDASGKPNGFWGTMNTEGAENLNGDAYSAYYDTQGGTTNPDYNATDFYNYAVEMPPGSSGGSVYVYDPVFCATDHAKGTGDRWWGSNPNQVSSFYELYDTNGTLQDIGDDGAPLADSLGTFGGIVAEDLSMGGTHPGATTPADCKYATDSLFNDGRDYHDRWYLLASGLTGGANGKVYRVHTTTTDKNNVGASRTTYGENSFALYTKATVGTPRIYGIGAMQAFTPLSASGSAVSSEFYLAQIDAVHAGKTVEIKLWDPGDTNPLSGTLSILVPDAGGWNPTLFDYTAAKGTTNGGAANCNALAGNNVLSVQTSTPTSRFNGCWLTIQVLIPSGYTAQQSGWWKIRYTMTGTGTSDDVTTWKVAIRGNPVHLVVP